MTEQITLGIKGRGQNPEKDDVIKSTDIFEKDSLVPGQEPTLREDLTLTVEPEPTVTSNVAQTATTFTEDTMKDAISLENHLWGTKLSLETALESLKETTDEFEKLNLAKENHQATTTEQFALESIGQRMKAGLNRVIEFLKNLWKRLIAWVKGERGQSAEEKIQRAQEAVKKNDAREAAIDRFMEQAFEEIFGEEDSAAPFAKAAAFKAKADDVQDDLDKKINDLNDSLKDTAASINKFAETTSKVQEMVDEAKKVNEILEEATAILEEPHKPVKDAKDLYKKLRKEYGKEGSPNASARVRDMEKRLSTIEDISKAIEKDELTPEAGGAMTEALRAAAKAAKFEEERIRAESIIAETIIRIEKEIASEVAQGPEFEIGSRSTAYNSATSSEEEEDYVGVPVTILGSKKNFIRDTRSYLVKIESGRNKGFYGSARKSSPRQLKMNPKNGELYITEMSHSDETKEAFAERYDFIIGKNVDAANESLTEPTEGAGYTIESDAEAVMDTGEDTSATEPVTSEDTSDTGSEDPDFEPPASPEDLPQQEDTSLNDPEYLEGEHEGQTEEETLQVIEERAEDLAVAAEALAAQTRVLEKLKANKVISVGFVTESMQTLGESPFKDPRYYTQLPSRTNYDYSVESLGKKIKTGAKELKDRLTALIKRFWQWLKGLYTSVKQRIFKSKDAVKAEEEEFKETAAAAREEAPDKTGTPFAQDEDLKPILEEPETVNEAPLDKVDTSTQKVADKPVELVYQLIGYSSPEYPFAQSDYNERLTDIVLRLNSKVKQLSEEFIKAVRSGDIEAARAALAKMEEESAQLDQEREALLTRNKADAGQLAIMNAPVSFDALYKAADLLIDLRAAGWENIAKRTASSNEAQDLSAYEELVDTLGTDANPEYLQMIQKAITIIQRFVRTDASEIKRALESLNRDFPVNHVTKAMDKYRTRAGRGKGKSKSDGDPSEKGMREVKDKGARRPNRRKPYWDR